MNKKILIVSLFLGMSISSASADMMFNDLYYSFLRAIKINGPLIGDDVDNNEIRDDVEEEIKERFPNVNQQNVYLSWAKHYEKVLKLEVTSENSKKWWKENERVYDCAIGVNVYGYGMTILEDGYNKQWVRHLVYNKSNRWNKYNDWLDETYRDNGFYTRLDTNEIVILMNEICDFKINDIEKVRKSALDNMYSLKDFSQSGIFRSLKDFEKKHGTKYRNIYETKFFK